MDETRTIEIRLPEGADLDDDDLALLRTACEALVGLSCGREEPPAPVRAMTDEGWRVSSSLAWLARAERGREYEEAAAATRGEALCALCQLTGLHTVDGCP